ncbi:unknown protein [Synechococcus elongatus PCC 6301]|uniref:Uncharacterized protein n=1 Tax=Synechococcus sp. (strain ATCC 27144 / PCC 6301 / SAUG 1402/1) TaxID=269084 RepID=A0A0H3K188_SYNP6|nr:hypothetical protein [Synechococcus elongatus]BAD78977.1 unknown protein [Synechococcus elongatus PCC 6301]
MPLTADSNGQITGSFTIPANVPTGTKRVSFRGSVASTAAARFIGEGQILTRTQRQVNTITRTVTTINSIVEVRADPLAQTFRLEQGRHITGIDLQFKARGSVSNNVIVEIRETEVGIPNDVTIMNGLIRGADINLTGWTRCTFQSPVYLQPEVEYAIVILTDDPIHAVAIAELGKFDPVNGWVTSQPYTVGTLLKSSNASTWTPFQEADLTFRLYGAAFSSNSRTVNLGQIYQAQAISVTRSGTTVTVNAPGHGLQVGDKAIVYGAGQTEYNGSFTVTGVTGDQFTYTIVGAPVTPATGTIRVLRGDNTDLITLAGVDRVNSDTDVEFIYTRPDGSQIRGSDNVPIQLAENLNDPVTLSAILRGNPTQSPTLFAGSQAIFGRQAVSANYVSRAFPSASGARVSATFEAFLPSGSGVTVEFQKGDGSWQAVTLTSSTPLDDQWAELTYTLNPFTASGTTTRVRLTLSGTAAARPRIRQLRVVTI